MRKELTLEDLENMIQEKKQEERSSQERLIMEQKEEIEKQKKLLKREREKVESVTMEKSTKPPKKRMKTGKKTLFLAYGFSAALVIFTMVMIFMGNDTTSLTILATAGVGVLPIMYGIYEKFSTDISLESMEQNYIVDYDEKKGLY